MTKFIIALTVGMSVASSASAATQWWTGTVTAVRGRNGDNWIRLVDPNKSCSNGDAYLAVSTSNAGGDAILKIALAAYLSGKTIFAKVDDPGGQRCVIEELQIQD